MILLGFSQKIQILCTVTIIHVQLTYANCRLWFQQHIYQPLIKVDLDGYGSRNGNSKGSLIDFSKM